MKRSLYSTFVAVCLAAGLCAIPAPASAKDKHAKKIDQSGFVGFEVFGNGTYKSNGNAAHFFTLILVNKKDPSKGVAVVGMGTPDGFKRHHPGIYEALHTIKAH